MLAIALTQLLPNHFGPTLTDGNIDISKDMMPGCVEQFLKLGHDAFIWLRATVAQEDFCRRCPLTHSALSEVLRWKDTR